MNPARKFLLCLAAVMSILLCLTSAPAPAEQDLQAKINNKLGMDFVLIQPGGFMMGSHHQQMHAQRSEAMHMVTITKPFYMQANEVTLGQWWAVMGKKFFGTRKGPENGPVVKVSYYGVQRFIKSLNKADMGTYRLPTEAEWEYCARAGSKTLYPWGDAISCKHAMYANNDEKRDDCVRYFQRRGLLSNAPAPVKSFPPNAWGLYDMSGNVWEWVSDWWGDYPKGHLTDPQGPESGTWRARRGGSWFGGSKPLRSANRNFAHPASKYSTLGFRLVKVIK